MSTMLNTCHWSTRCKGHPNSIAQSRGKVKVEWGGPLLLVKADEYCSGSGNSDYANQSNGESDEADSDGRTVKFR